MVLNKERQKEREILAEKSEEKQFLFHVGPPKISHPNKVSIAPLNIEIMYYALNKSWNPWRRIYTLSKVGPVAKKI